MKVTTETITPLMARRYLDTSTGNRNVRAGAVTALAFAMKHGKFHENGQTIRFAEGGRLMDGHHRLAACILAETPFKSIVVRGVQEEASGTIDTGIARTLSDHLKFRGESYYNNASATTAAAAGLLTSSAKGKLTIDMYDQWTACFRDGHAFVMNSLVTCKFMRGAPVAGAFAMAYRADPERVEKFALAVREGDVAPGSIGMVLRDFLMMSGRGARMRAKPIEISRKVLLAIHCHLHGKRREKLYASTEVQAWFVEQYKGTRAAALARETAALRAMSMKVIEVVNAPKVIAEEKAAA